MPARTPEEADRLFVQALNDGDLDALVDLYEATASFVPQKGPVVTGKAGIRQALSRFLAMKPQFDRRVEKVVPAGDDLALLYSRWTMTANGSDGDAVTTAGRGVELVRRHYDGTWLFAIDDPFVRTTA